METSVVAHVFIFEKTPDGLDSFFKSSAAFVERHTEASELVRQKRARETDFEPSLADPIEHADLACKLQRMIEGGKNRAGNQLQPPATLSGGAQEHDWIRRVPTIPVKVVFNDTDMMKAHFVGLADDAKTFIEINVGGSLFGPHIGEKIDSCFH
jgi:hypothetical protein